MSEGPLISCPWFHDAVFIVLKASPEGYLFQASGITKGRKISSWSMWRRGKSKYFKGPFIKMLRRNTPYGNIIYMLRLLENDRKTSFLTDLFSRSRYMKRVQLFNARYTKGIPFVKNSIQLFREKLSQKICTRQSRKVIWDMINTLFLTTVAVRPTLVAFL